MARFTLLMSYSEAGGAALTPEQMEQGRVEFDRYAAALHEAGILVAAEVFQPVASSVTIRGGEVVVATDDSAEQLSGVFLIDVPDLDAAVEWAKRCPAAAWGTMDVRAAAVSFVDGQWRN
ncbi:hypothetical protein M2152_001533 [Microbacteriaceae bacterium SG_E_30_P1]|uniref:YCII-related domain-containing protein n=1 Tax=Antiquaquibacter oligotrophicus TaxID=2880260 RepID=A0ABT6KMW5_9MICO|nr:YciI family protein [Antiquaquibacter oligotrophicus]MDH6181351.1 hypothetical protein [Antiquaquibacter oligotrophicus]UDF12956.1 YciI family protein [Antiquaquibacter oligotrophicus]